MRFSMHVEKSHETAKFSQSNKCQWNKIEMEKKAFIQTYKIQSRKFHNKNIGTVIETKYKEHDTKFILKNFKAFQS